MPSCYSIIVTTTLLHLLILNSWQTVIQSVFTPTILFWKKKIVLEIENYSWYNIWDWFYSLNIICLVSIQVLHILILSFFVLMSSIPIVWMHQNISNHSFTEGYVGSFQFGAITNKEHSWTSFWMKRIPFLWNKWPSVQGLNFFYNKLKCIYINLKEQDIFHCQPQQFPESWPINPLTLTTAI